MMACLVRHKSHGFADNHYITTHWLSSDYYQFMHAVTIGTDQQRSMATCLFGICAVWRERAITAGRW